MSTPSGMPPSVRKGSVVRVEHDGKMVHGVTVWTRPGRPKARSKDEWDREVHVQLADGTIIKSRKRHLEVIEAASISGSRVPKAIPVTASPARQTIVDIEYLNDPWQVAPGPSWLEYFSVDNEDRDGRLPHERDRELFPRKHPGIRQVVQMERDLIRRQGR